MAAVVSCTSLIGTRSNALICPTVRCVSGSKVRTTCSVQMLFGSCAGAASAGAKRSRMPPRTAYSPVSRTVALRMKPLISSHSTSLSMSMALPGAAENVSCATLANGGTFCSTAEIVVERIRGRSSDERERASRARAVMRRAEIEALGDTRS